MLTNTHASSEAINYESHLLACTTCNLIYQNLTHTEHSCGDSKKIPPKLDVSKIYNLPSAYVTRP